MSRARKNNRNNNKKTKQEKYNADNEIIIGVTTINKEKRVDSKKSTRMKDKRRTSKDSNRRFRKKEKNNYYNYNEEISEFSKEQTIKKNNKKFVIIGFIISTIILIAGLVFVMTTPRFYITEIEIEGNDKNSSETYISLTKIELNTTNIFAISKNSIVKNIKENPYVESVEIKRVLPNKLQLNIKEREEAYQIKYNDDYVLLDKQGYVLKISKEKKDIIELIGLDCIKEEIKECERLKDDDLIKLDTVLKIVNQFKYNSIENTINSIDISNKSNIEIIIDNGDKKVYLGDASGLSERILWLKTVLEKEGKNKGEIFINGNLNESKVYFKPREK